MCSDNSCVLALTKKEADSNVDVINEWRNDLESESNPDSLRTLYATNQIINALHGSDSHESAMR